MRGRTVLADEGAREARFLALLLDGADIAAFHAAFAATRDTLSAAELGDAQDRLAEALTIREQLAEQRQRSRELGAIVETAADLARLRDVDALLHAICARVRALLATDAAWLTYDDPVHGDSYTRATHGIVSDEFRRIRLARESGLGGLVIAEGSPQVTDDYLDDKRFVHTARFDAAVAAEGLRSMVGVPLRRGDDTIGVVLTGTRGPRRFTLGEISLLESLAAHAAIALENSRLFDESQRALEDLRAAEQRIRRHARAMEQSVGLDERLMSLVLSGADVPTLAAAIADVLGGSVTVLDAQSRVLAVAGTGHDAAEGGAAPGEPAPQLAAALRTRPDDDRPVTLTDHERGLQRLVVPLRAPSETLGVLILTRPDVADAESLLTRATTVVSLVLVNERDVAEAENRVRDELLNDVLRSPATADHDTLRRRAARFGLDLDQPHAVAVAEVADPTRWTAINLAREVRAAGGIAGVIEGAHVVLLPGVEAEEAMAIVERSLGGTQATIGAAGPANGMPTLAEAHEQARRTMQALLALGRPGTKATARRLGFFGLLCQRTDPDRLAELVDDAVGALIRYDAAHDTTMLPTLEAFFQHGGHMANTATALHIHVNTLYQRLDRITQILGAGWREPDAQLQLHLAVRLRRLAAEVGPDDV